MATRQSSFAAVAAVAAAFSLSATPAAAVELPTIGSGEARVQTGAAAEANQWRDSRYRHRDRGGIDAGDVIAGVAVIGAIAAIASASSRNPDRYEGSYPPQSDPRYDTRDTYDSSGVENAVDMCVGEVERSRQDVGSVDDARRTRDGWYVSGALRSGSGWECWIDNNGRIQAVEYGAAGYAQTVGDNWSGGEQSGGYYSGPAGGGQLSDDVYARARAGQRYAPDAPGTYGAQAAAPVQGQPAYPGGPLPGEEGYEESLRYAGAR